MRRTSIVVALALVIPALACPGDDEASTTASTIGGSHGASTTDPGTTSGEGSSSMGSSGAATAGGSSGPPADGSSSTGAGTSPLDACLATCHHLVDCGLEDVPNCGIPCTEAPGTAAGCSAEYVAQQECAAALSCEELQAWVDAMVVPGAHPCEAEDDAYRACENGADEG